MSASTSKLHRLASRITLLATTVAALLFVGVTQAQAESLATPPGGRSTPTPVPVHQASVSWLAIVAIVLAGVAVVAVLVEAGRRRHAHHPAPAV